MPTRSENRRFRHRQIIDSARELYMAHGAEKTTMEMIAQAAGCTRRTLYAYFQSWDDVCLYVFVEDLKRRWIFQLEMMGSESRGIDRLRAWGLAYLEYARNNPHTLRQDFFWDYHGIHNERVSAEALRFLREAVAFPVADLGETFRWGQAEGTIRPDLDVESTLGQYAYCLRAILNRALFPATSFTTVEPESFVTDFIDLFLRGISNHPNAEDA